MADTKTLKENARKFSNVTMELIWAKLDDLDVDSYQRVLRDYRVDKLVANWDWRKVGAITVSARKNTPKWFVIDGQNRVGAALKRNIHELPALILHGQQHESEAEIFHDTNANRYALNSTELFNSRIEAGDEAAIEITKILANHGLGILGLGDSTGWRGLGAVAACDDIYEWGYLDETVMVIKAAFPEEEKALQRPTLLSIASLYKNYGALLDTDRLISVLAAKSIRVWLQAADGMRGAMGGQVWPHLARTMLHEYNSGLQRNRLDGYRQPKLMRMGKYRTFAQPERQQMDPIVPAVAE